jgi:biotin carboxyl carrier protein
MSEYVVTVNARKKKVRFLENTLISVDDKKYNQELYHLSGDTYILKLDNKIFEISAHQIDNERFMVSIDGHNIETIIRTSLQEKAIKLIELQSTVQHKSEVKAPMPGMVLKIVKQVGDEVIQGDSILILEAMKMENDLRSHITGKIKSINVKEGMAVEKGFSLFTIE